MLPYILLPPSDGHRTRLALALPAVVAMSLAVYVFDALISALPLPRVCPHECHRLPADAANDAGVAFLCTSKSPNLAPMAGDGTIPTSRPGKRQPRDICVPISSPLRAF